MQHITFDRLYATFSKARILRYFSDGDSPDKVLARYHANIVLSEAMIPALHYFEISFRNRIDQVFKKYYASEWLTNTPNQLMVSAQDIKKINEIISKVRRENKRLPIHDDIVAQMTFGFWCSFLHRKYDPVIWHRKDAIKIIFPNLPRANKKRSYIEHKIFKIKEIRNRIAHHEPVWNSKVSIFDAHAICLELIHAMSHDAAEMLRRIDKFPTIYHNNLTRLQFKSISDDIERVRDLTT